MNMIRITCLIISLLFLFPIFAEKDIRIITNPAGAGVYYDGKKLGNTPLTLSRESSDLPLFKNPGKPYEFIIYKDFFEGEIASVSYERGKKTEVKIDLQYLKRLPLYDGIFQAGYVLNFYKLLMNYTDEQLVQLRNEIYAKYGGKLEPAYKETLGKKIWYKENPYFTKEFFSDTDVTNLETIANLLSSKEEDIQIQNTILSNYEYKGNMNTIIFHDNTSATIIYCNNPEDSYELNEEAVSWRIVSGTIYLCNSTKESIYRVSLNHEYSEIEQFEDISYEYQQFYDF